HGSNFMADHFQKQARFWGIAPSYAFVGEPETNGVIERLFRTLKEQAIHGRVPSRPSTTSEKPSAPSPPDTTPSGSSRKTDTAPHATPVPNGSTQTSGTRHNAAPCPGNRAQYIGSCPGEGIAQTFPAFLASRPRSALPSCSKPSTMSSA